jgi:ADP-ribose pyrophosphatase YjhB (NUDIX family)
MKSPESQMLLDADIESTVLPAYHQLSNVLVRYGNKVLLLHRKTEPFSGSWSIPGGGKEDEESYLLAAY